MGINRIVFGGIIFVLVFTQLAFGGVHVWAYTFFESALFLLLLLFFCGRVFSQYRTGKGLSGKIGIKLQWVVSPLNLFFVLIISLILMQLIPLPKFIVKFVSPYTVEIKSIFKHNANAWMNLSIYNFSTHKELIKFFAFAALYLMIINTVRERKRIKTLIYVLLIMGLFQVLYGLAQTYSNSQKIWWWPNDYSQGWVTGTYINRNHLAGFLEMVIPLCMGFVIANLKTRKPVEDHMKYAGGGHGTFHRKEAGCFLIRSHSPKPANYCRKAEPSGNVLMVGDQVFKASVRNHDKTGKSKLHKANGTASRKLKVVRKKLKGGERDQNHSISSLAGIRNWISSKKGNAGIIFWSFVAVTLGLALLLTGSRGAIISFGVCMFFMALLFLLKRGYRKCGIIAICLCLFMLTYGLYVGIEKTVKRFENARDLHDRLEITRSVIPMIQQFPLLGIGWGNFNNMYPKYALPGYSGRVNLGHAHNDWVEMSVELGLVGAFLILLTLGLYLTKTIKSWFQSDDSFAVGIGAGVIAAVVSISIHSFFDFNMHIPANPMVLFSILAIGFMAMHTDRRSTKDKLFYKTKSVIVKGKGSLVLLLVCVLAISGFIFKK